MALDRFVGPLFAVLTVAIPTATARAAPSAAAATQDVTEQRDPNCQTTPSLDEAKLIIARDLYARGYESFGNGDYLGAVKAWEQVLLLIPNKQAELRVSLAHAHRHAYAVNDDQGHLHAARALFTEQITNLSANDAARKDLEALIADIDATFAAIDAANARAEAKREAAIRQDQIRRNEQALAKAKTRHRRKVQNAYYGVGCSLAVMGVGSLSAMTYFLAHGARVDRDIRETRKMTNVPEGRYRELLKEGMDHNRKALATGVVGGVLTLSGASLLIVAAIRHKRVIRLLRERKVALVPALGGVGLRF